MSLADKLDKMAESLLEKCQQADVKFDQQIDAFKAVSTYYIATSKPARGKKPNGEAKTFNDIVSELHNHDGGTA